MGPQPRDPPNGRSPPSRPPKPVQPRDDGCNRSPNACYAGPDKPAPKDPWPRDAGNGRWGARLARDPNPRDPGT
ncbi:hypothetical protein LTR09_010175 [Extremus antarcticus]|uniref:Uncharacterized protein n=1 Tax=Extremus antarcticus TaxID=702011 RepID=A0AAJ0G8M8_9PEZI|nr:hypothetical protein LTR09_010175 [Extremus antarcticus]